MFKHSFNREYNNNGLRFFQNLFKSLFELLFVDILQFPRLNAKHYYSEMKQFNLI